MSRPPLPVGTHGKIKTIKISSRNWQSYARYRAADGSVLPIKRNGKSKTQAENRLKEAVKDAVGHAQTRFRE